MLATATHGSFRVLTSQIPLLHSVLASRGLLVTASYQYLIDASLDPYCTDARYVCHLFDCLAYLPLNHCERPADVMACLWSRSNPQPGPPNTDLRVAK